MHTKNQIQQPPLFWRGEQILPQLSFYIIENNSFRLVAGYKGWESDERLFIPQTCSKWRKMIAQRRQRIP
jgi:hypothetical protein